jgi:uncharacterized protein GlcG (DUF336 family)
LSTSVQLPKQKKRNKKKCAARRDPDHLIIFDGSSQFKKKIMFGEVQIPDDVKAQAEMFPDTQSFMMTIQVLNAAVATSNKMYEAEKAKIAAKEEARDKKRALLRQVFEDEMRALDAAYEADVQPHRANIAEVKAAALPLYEARMEEMQTFIKKKKLPVCLADIVRQTISSRMFDEGSSHDKEEHAWHKAAVNRAFRAVVEGYGKVAAARGATKKRKAEDSVNNN